MAPAKPTIPKIPATLGAPPRWYTRPTPVPAPIVAPLLPPAPKVRGAGWWNLRQRLRRGPRTPISKWIEHLLPAWGIAAGHLLLSAGDDFQLWRLVGLPAVLLGALGPLRRRAERSAQEAATWHAVFRRTMWRKSSNLLLGSVALLLGSWALQAGGLGFWARSAGLAGVLATALALLPVVVEPVLARGGPAAMRRAARTTRLREEIAQSMLLGSASVNPFRLTPPRGTLGIDLRPLPDIDADRGASGRIKATHEYAGRHFRQTGERREVVSEKDGQIRSRICWNGELFEVTGVTRKQPLWIPLAAGFPAGPASPAVAAQATNTPDQGPNSPEQGRKRSGQGTKTRPVAELVWVQSRVFGHRADGGAILRRHLLFLDAEGFVIVAVTLYTVGWDETVQLAMAAGMPCAAYEIRNRSDNAERLQKLMFPQRRSSIVI